MAGHMLIEYERGTRSEEDLIKKRDRLLEYDDYRFVCSPENFRPYFKNSRQDDSRGETFADWVESPSSLNFKDRR